MTAARAAWSSTTVEAAIDFAKAADQQVTFPVDRLGRVPR
jgi:hypothetical protein